MARHTYLTSTVEGIPNDLTAVGYLFQVIVQRQQQQVRGLGTQGAQLHACRTQRTCRSGACGVDELARR